MPKRNSAAEDAKEDSSLDSSHSDLASVTSLRVASDEIPPPPSQEKEPAFNPKSLSSDKALTTEILRIKNLIENNRARAPYHGDSHEQRHALVRDIIDGVRNLDADANRKEELLTLARLHFPRAGLNFISSYVDTSVVPSFSQKLLTEEIQLTRKDAPATGAANTNKP